jgi:hypothetical protein
VKNDHAGDQQPKNQRHQHWRNKPLPEIESTEIGHVTALMVKAGAQTLSVTDSCRGRAVMAKAVTAPSSNSEANRIRRTAINAGNSYEAAGIRQTKRDNSAEFGNRQRKQWLIKPKERTLN